MDLCQTKFQLCWVLCFRVVLKYSCCGFRIKLAVGSLHHPGMIWNLGCVLLDEIGNYLHSQLVSPLWTWAKIPLRIPNFLPMEVKHQTKQFSRYSQDLWRPRDYKGVLNLLTNSHELAQIPMSSSIQKIPKESRRLKKNPKDSEKKIKRI